MKEASSTNGITTLQEIVVELDQYKKNRFETTGRQLIIVDRESGEILDEPPVFNFWNKKLRYFEIRPSKVAFDVKGPDISVNYSNSPHPFVLGVTYNAQLAAKGIYNFIRSIYDASTPVDAINNILREAIASFVFERKDFVVEYKKYEPELEKLIIETGAKCGLKLTPHLFANIYGNSEEPNEAFISCDHKVTAKTKDAQIVEIDHYLALTLTDIIKLKLSGEKDIKAWARLKLDQFTNNAIIEKNYAEVLVNMEQSIIKQPMQEVCRQIGYELKQLISVPGLEIEKLYFETVGDNNTEQSEYATKDMRLKIALNVIVGGRLNLHDAKTKEYIKPNFDIIAGMKKNVIEFVKIYLNDITPEECFTRQYTLEESIVKMVRSKLENTYGFRELSVSVKFLENNLSRRLSLLQERLKEVELIGDWGERSYSLWFRVWGVTPEGWYRFRSNNYTSTDEELKDIARLVKNGMESAILRIGEQISGSLIVREFNNVRQRVSREFGLDIRIHDFNEGLSKEEHLSIRMRNEEIEEKFTQMKLIQQGETDQLEEYLELKRGSIEHEENDEVVKKLDEKIASFRNNAATSKEKFLQQKTDNPLLLPLDDNSDNELKPEDIKPKD